MFLLLLWFFLRAVFWGIFGPKFAGVLVGSLVGCVHYFVSVCSILLKLGAVTAFPS
jgi:hypothetical protein